MFPTQTIKTTPDLEFVRLATEEQIVVTTQALEANGMRVLVVENGAAARQAVFDLLPEGAEVFDATSRTLETIGVSQELSTSPRYISVRRRLLEMDRATQGNEMRRLGASPDYVVGSVHTVTEQGQLIIASATGSQLGPYVYGAGKVIWVIGTQKIVPDFDTALRRLHEYAVPLEDTRAREAYGFGTAVNKLLIFNREIQPGRVTVILVKEQLGF